MKIGSSPENLAATSAVAAADAALRGGVRAAGRPTAAAGAPVDQVAVSAAGVQMGALGGTVDFDSVKVDIIRQAIREGRFSVNAEAIADRLIADAAALLGPRIA